MSFSVIWLQSVFGWKFGTILSPWFCLILSAFTEEHFPLYKTNRYDHCENAKCNRKRPRFDRKQKANSYNNKKSNDGKRNTRSNNRAFDERCRLKGLRGESVGWCHKNEVLTDDKTTVIEMNKSTLSCKVNGFTNYNQNKISIIFLKTFQAFDR